MPLLFPPPRSGKFSDLIVLIIIQIAKLLLRSGARLVLHPLRGTPLHVSCNRANPLTTEALLESEEVVSS
jgi:hypothetical protein